MSCFGGGTPIGQTFDHLGFTQVARATFAETISITAVAIKHIVMEQWVAHWGAIPTTSESIVLSKLSGVNPLINTVLRSFNPSAGAENVQDLACVIPFYWNKGDTIQITYLNTDDLDVGTEILLVEVK